MSLWLPIVIGLYSQGVYVYKRESLELNLNNNNILIFFPGLLLPRFHPPLAGRRYSGGRGVTV